MSAPFQPASAAAASSDSSSAVDANAARRPFGRKESTPMQPQQPLMGNQAAQAVPSDSNRMQQRGGQQMQSMQPQSLGQQSQFAQQQQMLASQSQPYPASSSSSSAGGVPLQPPTGADPDGLDQSADPNAGSARHGPGAHGGRFDSKWMAQSSLQSSAVSVWHSKDPISNLQIRVLLRKQPEDASSIANPKTLKQLLLVHKDQERKAQEASEAKQRALDAGNMAPGKVQGAASRIAEGDEDADNPASPSALDDASNGGASSPLSPGARRSLNADLNAGDASGAAGSNVVASAIFAWQQKVCSPVEIYLAALGARTASSYKDQARSVLASKFPGDTSAGQWELAARRYIASHMAAADGMAISSKRDHDRWINPDDLNKRVVTTTGATPNGDKPALNPLAERIVLAPLAAHKSDSHLTREGGSIPFHLLATVDLPRDNPDQIRLLHRTNPELNSHPPAIAGTVVVPLVSLKVTESDSKVTLEMRPGFSPPLKVRGRDAAFDESEWYSFHTPAGEQYRYRIENFSEPDEESVASAAGTGSGPSKSFLAIESAKLEAEALRLAMQEMSVQLYRSGREFESGPPRGHISWIIMGEIVKTRNFEEEDLAVAFELDCRNQGSSGKPSGSAGGNVDRPAAAWSASSNSITEAISQRSQALLALPSIAGRPRVREAYLSFPFHFRLLQHTGSGPSLPPILYFTVLSWNRWGQSSPVGYAFCHLPSTPGCHEIELNTWVPLGSLRMQKAQYFLGQGPTLRDMKLCGLGTMVGSGAGAEALAARAGAAGAGGAKASGSGVGTVSAEDKSVLNRYGWECSSKGSILIRLEIVALHPQEAAPVADAAAYRNAALSHLSAQAMEEASRVSLDRQASQRAADREKNQLMLLRQNTLTQRAAARTQTQAQR